ncbi:MAG TPA: addiction module protein [Gemmata sp.]|jgi:putative addiction module component (TIGR02574 family)|nr:addiction module protein [Gemmata sp.]
MSATTTPETPEARDIIERALQLPPVERERIAHQLLDSVYPPDDPEEVKRAWRAELQHRMDAIRDGTMKTYSVEETMAYLRQALAERRA